MFSDKERLIFGPYFDGQGERYADPIAVQRRLKHMLGGDVNKVLERHRNEIEPVRFEATEQLIQASVMAFGLLPFNSENGQGCNEAEVLAVLDTYLEWLKKKRMKPEKSPTSPPFSGPVAGGLMTSISSSICGFTSRDADSSMPLLSPEAQESA